MRGEYGGLGAAGKGGLERFVPRHQVERVGVQDQGCGAGQGGGHQVAGGGGLAEAGAHAEGAMAVLVQQGRGAAEHEFGAFRVHCQRAGIKQPDKNTAGTQVGRGPPGEQGRPHHARGSADEGGVAVAALVAVARARAQPGGKQGGVDGVARGGGKGFRVQIKGGEMDAAAVVRPVEGEQAGLEGDEGDGVIGREAGAGALAGIGIETAGDVEGQTQPG